MGLSIGLNFPYDVDSPLSRQEISKNIDYYKTAYQTTAAEQESAEDPRYLEIAREAAQEMQIEGRVRHFVTTYGLADKKVLEIGSGRGYLQDIVNDYTGLDISPSVRRFYHKNFMVGSANSMPFENSTFDGGWSIWVLEHVPNPEAALAEIRRVLKPGGVFYLFPAWTCNSWAADGYGVRPYSDFRLGGRLVKASVPIRESKLYKGAHRGPVRLMRYASYFAFRGPTRLRYIRLEPNYQKYWTNDSDAVNSIDRYEAQLWFVSRGDECLNCRGVVQSIPVPAGADPPLVIRVRK
ncbi:MAG: class I SAM-dependent methyltransferase [Vicinamibacterales bacterium]